MTSPLTEQQASLIQTTFDQLAPQAESIVSRFYQNLFHAAPGVRGLFPDDMTAQKRHLGAAIKLVAQNAHQLDDLAAALAEMGARHVNYGTQPEHYPVVRDVLLATLGEFGGAAWTAPVREAWTAALNRVAEFMIAGARNAAPTTPA